MSSQTEDQIDHNNMQEMLPDHIFVAHDEACNVEMLGKYFVIETSLMTLTRRGGGYTTNTH